MSVCDDAMNLYGSLVQMSSWGSAKDEDTSSNGHHANQSSSDTNCYKCLTV